MNNRLAIQDLAGLLAEYTGKDKNSSERFLREFIAVVSEGVYTDKLVKVKGLGTFKIIPVEKRESIHVNTGERFVIPEHYKFSFLPDKELRELVNKPFSFFETTELRENVDFTDMDVVLDEPDIKETEDESIEEMIPEEKHLPEEEPVVFSEEGSAVPPEEDPVVFSEEEPAGQPEDEGMNTLEPVVDERSDSSGPDSPSEEVETGPDAERKKPRTKRIAVVSMFVFLLMLFNIGLYLNRTYFFEKEKESLRIDTVFPKGETVATEAVPDTTIVFANEDSSQTVGETTVENPEVEHEAVSPKIIARVKIEPGSRLTLISLKYYGSKLFWVYLYEYNRAVITDPNNVPIGTVIEVPAPEMYGIDRRDRSSIEKAAARQTEILSGKL
ncbi:HU family DNA-binding protein [Parabacteroides sp.]|uniref:HU family DNA-binding protein n=1 Tax=Parabacteroides sp. TaxID=1869337 RepID=UPI00257FFC63|nr:HU family DNA-binding protein [Parabacteroides sp.]MBS1380032.1 HU family DNA-binding protein [Parabacteroides sp.]